MKKRRFADGGETDPELESGVRSGPNPNIDDDTRQRAAEYVGGTSKPAVSASAFPAVARRGSDTEEAPAKPKVVTKEELEKSGLSLRDYMNKQQGLTRRSTPYTGTGGSGGGRGPTAEELASYKPPRRKLSDLMPSEESIQKGLEIGLPAGAGASMLGRLAKGLAGRTAKPAAEAAQQALAAPVKRIGFDKAGAKAAERGARAETRQAEMLKENARRSGLREDAPEATKRAVRERLGGDDWSLPMKKGGAVQKYANGGAVKAKGWGMARGCRAAKIV